MARPNFYDSNANRSFPFLAGVVGQKPPLSPDSLQFLPNDVVVDFGAVMGCVAEYGEGTHSVWLSRVRRQGNTFYFYFETDAPGCGEPLIFTRNIGERFAAEFQEAHA